MSNVDVLIEIIMGFLLRISDVSIKIWAFPIVSHPYNLVARALTCISLFENASHLASGKRF